MSDSGSKIISGDPPNVENEQGIKKTHSIEVSLGSIILQLQEVKV